MSLVPAELTPVMVLKQMPWRLGDKLLLFHLNYFLLPCNFTKLHNLLALTDVKYDVIGISESTLNIVSNGDKNIEHYLADRINLRNTFIYKRRT